MLTAAPPPYLTDDEVDEMCAGLTQDAAKIRFLRRLGLTVHRKPNGRPLVWRPASAPGTPEPGQDVSPGAQGVIVGLQAWATGRRRHGPKTQGR